MSTTLSTALIDGESLRMMVTCIFPQASPICSIKCTWYHPSVRNVEKNKTEWAQLRVFLGHRVEVHKIEVSDQRRKIKMKLRKIK